MGDVEVLKLVFGILLTVWSIVLLFIAFKFFYKYTKEKERCTEETVGEVVGYEWFTRGKGISLPVLVYEIDGEEYKTVGPHYKWYKTVRVRTPKIASTQEFTTDIYSQTFQHKITGSGMIIKNPMRQLFPVGTILPVYYDPKNPKLSYVLRHCDQSWLFWLTFSTGIVALLLNLWIQLSL